jgi:hypothetical protein
MRLLAKLRCCSLWWSTQPPVSGPACELLAADRARIDRACRVGRCSGAWYQCEVHCVQVVVSIARASDTSTWLAGRMVPSAGRGLAGHRQEGIFFAFERPRSVAIAYALQLGHPAHAMHMISKCEHRYVEIIIQHIAVTSDDRTPASCRDRSCHCLDATLGAASERKQCTCTT